jgi:hypothetical protein
MSILADSGLEVDCSHVKEDYLPWTNLSLTPAFLLSIMIHQRPTYVATYSIERSISRTFKPCLSSLARAIEDLYLDILFLLLVTSRLNDS